MEVSEILFCSYSKSPYEIMCFGKIGAQTHVQKKIYISPSPVFKSFAKMTIYT